ncbi:hypothetical protein [Mesorhizobium sp. B2-3-10]|uniref:hypothetical protein n=1 Tax=Mesorhizobium sp. B2-3-10 TaxID=2589954 RepID=UPI001128E065|nr:hypothetical protein [Mesorhizobium sp. B2-3-10]TPL94768.1 hypothetical protein FJ943_25120 [Mesorhizobium sp. B2-3-10]
MVTLFEKMQLKRERLRKEMDEIDLLLALLQKHDAADVDVAADDDDDTEVDEKDYLADDAPTLAEGATRHRNAVRLMKRLRYRQIVATTPPSKRADRPTRNLPKSRMEPVVRALIAEQQKPMTRTQIAEALELKGIPVAGADPNKAIGTILWRMRDKFVNLLGWGYWPIEEDFAPAAYVAPKDYHHEDPPEKADDDENEKHTPAEAKRQLDAFE